MKLPLSFNRLHRQARRSLCLAAAGGCLLAGWRGRSQAADAPPATAPAILQELHSFRELGSVLYIAAHPDDENNQLLAYLARGRNYRTAYLSLTRGDGGQNVLGPEFGAQLGVIRTQELLAARRVDGARQYFSRALDFGYSKDYLQTLKIWDQQEVLSDIVRVIREFRPDVLITRFPPTPSNTHGHHTASAFLAVQAFKLAGDPKSFPEQLTQGLTVWQPKRILMNSGSGLGGNGAAANALVISTGGTEPVTGQTFAQIAAQSRSMHKTQGLGNTGVRAGSNETFTLLDGEPAATDLLDGVDTTWGRYPGGAEIGSLTDDLIAKFNPQDPSASVPALLAIRSKLAALPKDPVVDEKRAQLDRILQACLGLTVETTISDAEVVPGETLKLHSTVKESSNIPVQWFGVSIPDGSTYQPDFTMEHQNPVQQMNDYPIIQTDPLHPLTANQASIKEAPYTLPTNTPLSTPYWLRQEGTAGMFRVDDPNLIGRPENPSALPLKQVFKVGGQTLEIPDEPVQVTTDPVKGETRRRLDVISPVTLHFVSQVSLFAPGATRPVEIEVTAYRANSAGTLQLNVPADWKVTPSTQPFTLAKVGDKTKFIFTVTAPAQPTTGSITARADINGAHFDNDRVVLHYNHIPPQMIQSPASVKAVALDLKIHGSKVGYLPGAGDSTVESLEQMGYQVTTLTGADLTAEKLHGLDAVVIGVRAFDVRTDLAANLPGLFAYVEAGGTVVAQYNRPDGQPASRQLGPYGIQLSNNAPNSRVTDENSPVTFLAPDHPALNTPNKITNADFAGWVQERGAYFPSSWDADHYTPILAMNDPGEAPLQGSVLVAPDGRGYFVYTGLAFFRQLPAGVPGAYRLFANLVSLGK